MLNLGGITFGLTADTTGLGAAQTAIQNFGQSTANAVAAAKGKIDETTQALIRQEGIAIRALQSVQQLQNRIAASPLTPTGKSGATTQLTGAFAGLTSTLTSGVVDPLTLQRSTLGFKENTAAISAQIAAARASAAPNTALIGLMRGLTDASALTLGPLDGMTYRMRAASTVMGEFGVGTGAVLAILAGFTIAAIGMSEAMIKQTIAVQQTEMTIKGITNSSAQASGEISFLRDTARQAGLAFTDLAPNFARFVASATGAGQSLSVTNTEFKQLALLAGTLHLSTEQMNGLMLAFDHMLSMGRVQGQQLRQLFNNMPAVFGIAQKAAKEMGVDLTSAMRSGSLAAGEFIQNFMAIGNQTFNIDINKPIDSLQASIGRVKGSWQEFVVAFTESLGASSAFKAFFTDVSNALEGMTAHMGTVIQVIGALAGAIGGLAAALAVVGAIAAVGAVIGSIVGIVRLFSAAMTVANLTMAIGTPMFFAGAVSAGTMAAAEVELATAQEVLNVAMASNPIGAFLTMLALLGTALFGAKLGYDALKKVALDVGAAMLDTSGIDHYITKQQELKTNIEAVTDAMIKQVAVATTMQVTQMKSAQDQLTTLTKAYDDAVGKYRPNMSDTQMAMGGSEGGTTLFTNDKSGVNEAAAALSAQAKVVAGLAGEVEGNANRLKALKGLALLPESGTVAPANPKVSNKDADRGLRAIDDMINKANDAQLKLDNMFAGPKTAGLIDALDDAKKRLFDLKPDQLGEIKRLLETAGLGGLPLVQALTVLREKTTLATETTKEFEKVWNDIDKGQDKLKGLKESMDYLRGGGDPENMWLVQAAEKARELLRGLDDHDLPAFKAALEGLKGKSGEALFDPKAIKAITDAAQTDHSSGLKAVQQALHAIGIDAPTAQEGLAIFERGLLGAEEEAKRFQSTMTGVNKVLRDLAATRAGIVAIRGGINLEGLANLEYLEKAKEDLRLITDPTDLQAISDKLRDFGIAGTDAEDRLANLYKIVDRNNQAIADQKKLLTANESAWVTWADGSVDAIMKVLDHTMTLKQGILTVFQDLGKTILTSTIFNPVKSFLDRSIKNMFEGSGTGGASTNPLDVASGDAAKALLQMTGIVGDASGTMSGDFIQSIVKSAFGMTTGMTAQQANTVSLATSTVALTAFTSAILAAAAASAGSAATNTIDALAATVFMVKDGGYMQSPHHFAFGGLNGLLHGPGGPRDDKIPAWVSNGEFIVNAEATSKNLNLLRAINNGGSFGSFGPIESLMSHFVNTTPAFASGGEVSPSNLYVPGMTNASSQSSSLQVSQGSTIIDARSTFHVMGDVSDETMAKVRAMADERDQRLMSSLPYIIDARVTESRVRQRYPR